MSASVTLVVGTTSGSASQSLLGLNLRRTPLIAPNNIVKLLPVGTVLSALDDTASVNTKVGQPEQWVHVNDNAGAQGYVLAEFVSLAGDKQAEGVAVVVNAEAGLFQSGGLALFSTPNANTTSTIHHNPGAVLTSLEPTSVTYSKVGIAGQWLRVLDAQGNRGFVNASSVHLRDTASPEVQAQRVVLTVSDAPLLEAARSDSASSWQVTAGTPLRVLDPDGWIYKVGHTDQFLHVRTYAFVEGYVQASLVTAPPGADKRIPVVDAVLPFGDCAWIYGLHDAFDRGLFIYAAKTGWVLFNERITSSECDATYDDWSRHAYFGVIARLNNEYSGGGTIPLSSRYGTFAAQCAQWVKRSRGCHIWVIGNEMNNPREWPNGQAITPELYADCFNRARIAIKSVQPEAIVVPGAIDPYLGPGSSCLEWFTAMLSAIDELDGFALHCYTHGVESGLVTNMERFADEPLRWQYYHFRCYTTFLDVIPARWRNKPVYITETCPIGESPWSGGMNNWVQAANAEIQRWNTQPFSQQIQALILYRWSSDNRYSIIDKPAIQNDIRATIATTDFRWRG